jgi:hypothetical protein
MGVVGRIGERNTTYGVQNTRLELMKSELLYRVAGAVAMRDGIAVANGGARQVWLYDGEARLSWRAGRAGDGPGEFQDLAAIFGIAGDSLLAYDTGLRRFQVVAPGGALTRTFQLDGPSSSGPPRGAFPLGVVAARLLIVQTVRPPATVAAGTGSVRGALDILRYDLAGRFVDTLTTVASWESYNSASAAGAVVPVRVYAADGTRMASIKLPSALQLQDVRSDSVLGLWSDSLGVESIRMYQLIRRQN